MDEKKLFIFVARQEVNELAVARDEEEKELAKGCYCDEEENWRRSLSETTKTIGT